MGECKATPLLGTRCETQRSQQLKIQCFVCTKHETLRPKGRRGARKLPYAASKQCTHPKTQGQAFTPAAPHPLNHIPGPLGMQQGSKVETKWQWAEDPLSAMFIKTQEEGSLGVCSRRGMPD